MASFNQWRRGLAKNPVPRQITYVCGEEQVLVDDVLAQVKDYLGPEPWNYVALSVGEDSERAIWAAANQFPLGGSPRLVVVRHVEDMKDWEPFLQWIKNRSENPRTHLVLISGEDKLPRTEPTPDERRKGEKPQLLPHLAAIGAKGHTIECRPYTSATAKYSLEWVQSKVKMREGVAKHLLERSNFDLRLVRDVCRKLAVFPNDINATVINQMLIERPRDSFSDALLAIDKKTALLALREIPTEEYGKVIGLLDSRIDLAGMVYDMQRDHKAPYEIARAAGAQAWLVPSILEVSKHYNAKRRLDIRRVLAMVDEAYRAGQRDGILETLVAYW